LRKNDEEQELGSNIDALYNDEDETRHKS